MNTKLRKTAKNNFGKDILKLMSNAFFGKTMENVRKHRYITLVITESNHHTTKIFTENVLATVIGNT